MKTFRRRRYVCVSYNSHLISYGVFADQWPVVVVAVVLGNQTCYSDSRQ